jgi:hypothetical protein
MTAPQAPDNPFRVQMAQDQQTATPATPATGSIDLTKPIPQSADNPFRAAMAQDAQSAQQPMSADIPTQANDPAYQALFGAPSATDKVLGAIKDYGTAAAHHVANIGVGVAQSAAHGLRSMIDAGASTAPAGGMGSSLAQYADNTSNQLDNAIAQREANYQKTVPDNAASYAGATVGEIAPWMYGMGELRAIGAIPEATSTAGKLTSLALEGGTMGGAQPVTANGSYASQKAAQVGIGAATGPLLYGGGRALGKVTGSIGNDLAHIRNPQAIADAEIASRLGTDPVTLQALRAAQPNVPGEVTPATQVIGGPNAVALDRLLRNNPNAGQAFAEGDLNNDAARHAVIANVAGDDATMAAAKQARQQAIEPFANQYLSDTTPAVRWGNAGDVLDSVLSKPMVRNDDLRALEQAKRIVNAVRSGAMQEDDATQAMNELGESVTSQKAQNAFQGVQSEINRNMIDPTPVLNSLKTLRNGPLGMDDFRAAKLDNMINTIQQSRNINGLSGLNMMDAARQKLGGILGKTSGQNAYALGSPYGQIVNNIERNAPGYRNYLADYASHSQPINDMEAARSILTPVDNSGLNSGGGARVTIPAIKSALAKDDAAQYGMSPEARAKVENVLKSLQSRSITNNKVGAQAASGTTEDLLAAQNARPSSLIFGDPMSGKHGILTSALSGGIGSGIGAAIGGVPGAVIGSTAGSMLPSAVSRINAGIARRVGTGMADSSQAADAIDRVLARKNTPSKGAKYADPMKGLLFGTRYLPAQQMSGTP